MARRRTPRLSNLIPVITTNPATPPADPKSSNQERRGGGPRGPQSRTRREPSTQPPGWLNKASAPVSLPRPASTSMVSRKNKASTPDTVAARPASTSTVSLKTNPSAASCTLYAHGNTGPGDDGMARPKTAWSLPRTGLTFTASRNKASTPRRQPYPVRPPCHLRVLNCQVCFIFLQFLNLVAGIVRGCR